MKIAVVIVNYRTPDLVVDCLASLENERSDELSLQVYVGDADSQDGSVSHINQAINKRGWSEWATCYDIQENGGFAFGNNHILKTCVFEESDIDYVHFLNPDTYIRPGAVQALAAFLDRSPAVGVAGSRLENPDQSSRAYAFRAPAPWREFFRGAKLGILNGLFPRAVSLIPSPEAAQQVDWVSGASFMVPRHILDRVGLLDSEFFLYFEETEFMARVRDAGFTVWTIPESRVVHLAGQATGVRSDAGSVPAPSPHWLASRRRYFRLRYGVVGHFFADLAFLVGVGISRLAGLIKPKRLKTNSQVWATYVAPWYKQK